jgi:hypothetical protein
MKKKLEVSDKFKAKKVLSVVKVKQRFENKILKPLSADV